MADRVFVDTNVLLRANHPDLSLHTEANGLLSFYRQNNAELWISRQVIREYFVQITRPGLLLQPLQAGQIDAQYKALRTAFQIADETGSVTEKLIELMSVVPTGGKQVHDANIVATMLVYGIDTLLTTNVEDMKRFADKVSVISLSPYP